MTGIRANLWTCNDCGKKFTKDEARVASDKLGDFWGVKAFDDMIICPHCNSVNTVNVVAELSKRWENSDDFKVITPEIEKSQLSLEQIEKIEKEHPDRFYNYKVDDIKAGFDEITEAIDTISRRYTEDSEIYILCQMAKEYIRLKKKTEGDNDGL